jgi:hypothetical protein
MTKLQTCATNGELVSDNGHGLMVDELDRYGYYAHFGGAWVCYTCGHLCDPDIHNNALESMGLVSYCDDCDDYHKIGA